LLLYYRQFQSFSIGAIILGEASQILTQFSRNISSYEGCRELHMGCKMFAMSTFIYDLWSNIYSKMLILRVMTVFQSKNLRRFPKNNHTHYTFNFHVNFYSVKHLSSSPITYFNYIKSFLWTFPKMSFKKLHLKMSIFELKRIKY